MRPRSILVASFVLVLAACSPGSSASSAIAPTVSGAWARAAAAGGGSAAYFTLTNPTGSADALVSVTSPAATTAQVHQTAVDGSGMAGMTSADRVALPAGATIAFAPGGYHVMLMGLSRDLTPGATIELDLVFEHAGTIVTKAEIRQS